jgi:hypothetical protein
MMRGGLAAIKRSARSVMPTPRGLEASTVLDKDWPGGKAGPTEGHTPVGAQP